jgi:hypothetical protein
VEWKIWGGKRESNPQPSEPQSGALPVELFPPLRVIIAIAVGGWEVEAELVGDLKIRETAVAMGAPGFAPLGRPKAAIPMS